MSRRRRGEGQTEYVVMTSLISICIVAGLFNFGNEVQEAMTRANVCITCEKDEVNEDEGGENGETGEGEELRHRRSQLVP